MREREDSKKERERGYIARGGKNDLGSLGFIAVERYSGNFCRVKFVNESFIGRDCLHNIYGVNLRSLVLRDMRFLSVSTIIIQFSYI